MLVAKVNNTPADVKGWVVARRDSYDASLWYYGEYETEKRAQDVAQELDDAVVVESVDK